ncbi:NACHT, LRR and PYD domains-containing protein 6-like [Thunnus thynnus]|uniref:NACHT, LRR and PYD domains-containing protein 6-like n=1 Tax=Thunnus thynnus TaxID=8237 RepID=UPI0035277BF9
MTKTDLINTLDDLIDDEFKTFKVYLRTEKVDNIKPIKRNQLEKADRLDTVDLMMQKYEFATAVKVMKSILKKINRNDLVRELSNIGSGAKGPGPAETETDN